MRARTNSAICRMCPRSCRPTRGAFADAHRRTRTPASLRSKTGRRACGSNGLHCVTGAPALPPRKSDRARAASSWESLRIRPRRVPGVFSSSSRQSSPSSSIMRSSYDIFSAVHLEHIPREPVCGGVDDNLILLFCFFFCSAQALLLLRRESAPFSPSRHDAPAHGQMVEPSLHHARHVIKYGVLHSPTY